jgi:NAD+ kinase
MSREVLVVAHPRRPFVRDSAQRVLDLLTAAGIRPRILADEAGELDLSCADLVGSDEGAADGVELVLVLGGDGSLLRGADLARSANAPLLGVNMGHIGFLAEAESEALDSTVEAVVARAYTVEERMTLDVVVTHRSEVVYEGWALNEATVEKAARERMLEVVLEVDERPLSTFGCDGIVVSTPTGSTAYAFSAGGPVVWPTLDAMLVVPLSAHALFARPLVVPPTSTIAVEVLRRTPATGVLWCDGRRMFELAVGARIEIAASPRPVRLARIHSRRDRFTDRLVRKFDLPVGGWRGPAS